MILFILMAAHFLADFTFQPNALAKRKGESFKFLLLHSLIYTTVMVIAGFSTVTIKTMVLPLVIIVVSHFAIDWLRLIIDSKTKSATVQFWSFIFDQALHLAVILAVYLGFELREYLLDWFKNGIEVENVKELIVCALIFIIIWDPASVFVKRLFAYIFNYSQRYSDDNEPKAGSIIGKLERLIIAVLVIFDQIGGIGFVLTAKSIARFKQFEEQGFAEKYLVGTLASASIAIIVSLILRMYI